jgi:putative transposase
MESTWISEEVAKERLGIGRCQFFAWLRRGKIAGREIVIRETEKTGNGRPRREVQLEALPARYQARYYRSAQVAGESDGTAPSQPAESVPPPAPTVSSLYIDRSEEEVTEATHLAEDLAAILEADDIGKARRSLAVKLGKTERTIGNYLAAYKKDRLDGLMRKKRDDAGRVRKKHRTVAARIQAEYLKPYRPPVSAVHRIIAKDFEMSGLKPLSYSFVVNVCRSIDPDLVARFRIGEREFDDKFAYITLRKKPPLPRQWVDADHHQMDHIVVFSDGSVGRTWLTAIQDICTNEILGYTLSREKRSTYPGAQAIALTLRQAILKKDDPAWPSFGIPENFYSDLGKDFRSAHVRGVCKNLGIRVRYARGYHGKSKPIERFFGTLESGIKHLPGYIGRSPETNPIKQTLGAPRAWEDMRGEILPIEQFAEAVHRWIIDTFHHAESKSLDGLSPLAALESHVKNGWSARAVPTERALDLLMMNRAGKKVQRSGVQIFGAGNVQRHFMAPELLDLIGQEVDVFWDPERIGQVIVYKDSRFVCAAQNRDLLGFDASEEDLKGERELKRRQKQSVRDRFEEICKQAQYPNDLARASAQRRMEKVETEERQKLAVGAEARGVPVMLPQFQQAAKKLAAVRSNGSSRSDNPKSQDNPWLKEEPFKASESKREKNPWLGSEDTPEVCHGCDKGGVLLAYCDKCAGNGYCPKCHASSKHRFCSDCINVHTHIEAFSKPPRPRPSDDGLKSSEELFGSSEAEPERPALLDSEDLFEPEE